MNPPRSEDKCNLANPISVETPRRVQFNNNVRSLAIPSLADLSLKEIEATWQTEDDKATSQADVVDSIRAMRLQDASTKASDHCCARGLEHFRSKAINQHLQQRRDQSIRAVLEEQRTQKHQRDPERLRAISERYTEEARIDAIVYGSIDSEFVHRMYRKSSQDPAKSVLSLTDQFLRPSSG